MLDVLVESSQSFLELFQLLFDGCDSIQRGKELLQLGLDGLAARLVHAVHPLLKSVA